ncbi:MAG: lamin tail domain-containing protein, partial [Phycisphaerales bacterium]|nr:lamin tail domain-containing protein [Phycisphaerales bacterium]
VPVLPNANPDPDNAANWRASSLPGGSPGADDPALPTARVLVSEVLSHSETGVDFIELFNPNAQAVDIGGWFLTDDPATPKKYRIADGTFIGALSRLVFDESDFNLLPGVGNSFSLNARGDDVYLFSGDANTNLTGYSHGFSFGAAPDGGTFGRYVISTGEEHFPGQLAATPANPNAGPRVGPVVINEIMYHPNAGEDEFIELKNFTTNTVALYDPTHPTNTWTVAGLGYTFPTNISLPPSGLLLIVATNSASFRAKYSIAAGVQILGPYSGVLQDSGERLELQWPDVPDTNGVAYITVDEVRYNDKAPWPAAADGSGPSLQRKNAATYGNDPANWEAATPTYGAEFVAGQSPVIVAQPQSQSVLAGETATFSVSVNPNPQGLNYQWRFNGSAIPGAISSTLVLPNAQPSQAGEYSVVVFNSAGSSASAVATLTVRRPPLILTQPPRQPVRPGATAIFTVNATGNGFLRYQWRFEGNPIPSATNAGFVITNAQVINEGIYSVIVSDSVGSVVSAGARLLILVDPFVIEQPLGQTVVAGGSVTLSLTVTNTATLPVGYRLRRSGVTLNETFLSLNERTVFFTITNVQSTFTNWSIVVTNEARSGGLLSSNAFLTVLADADADGIPDTWEDQYGFNASNSVDRVIDSDGDGMLNWQEYIAGTDPRDSWSYLRVGISHAGESASLEFFAVSNKTYAIQYDSAPSQSNWLKLAEIVAHPTNRVVTINDPAAATQRVYRLVTPRQN